MKYLLDTSLISAIGPTARRSPEIEAWFATRSDDLYLSVISVTEVRAGIAKAVRMRATRRAAALGDWWDAVEGLYADRILPFDMASATCAGAFVDRLRGSGQTPDFADVAIAAIAQVHDLIFATRNTKHFEPMLETTVDPFLPASGSPR